MVNELNSDEIDICALTDLVEDAGIAALLDGLQIALIYVKKTEQVFALSNYDPFSEANVLSRGIIGSIGDDLVVASPIYKQHFKLATGQCVEDESVSVSAYPVQIINGRVLLGSAS
ncbi:MAG: nitrite reductase small subunit NirD [Gammaproteobacteria bacterium]|nr:nitrite reductase small subunit NirD [Gammaproteobacteria bacterium]